jgi:hypothetical protein
MELLRFIKALLKKQQGNMSDVLRINTILNLKKEAIPKR